MNDVVINKIQSKHRATPQSQKGTEKDWKHAQGK
jgi:hypothetical protein